LGEIRQFEENNEVLVGVRPDKDNAMESGRLAGVVGIALEHHAQLHFYRLKLRPGLSVNRAIALLSRRGEVLYAEPNHIYHTCATPNDPYYSLYQYGPQKVRADLGWGIWNPTSPVVIAIADTGIDYTHPDLTNKILRNTVTGAVIGYNSVGSNAHSGNATDPIDDNGHGTHCAGIAAAQINNGTGIAGIAGWNGQAGVSDTTYTRLMPVKVLNSAGSGTDATVASGISWAAAAPRHSRTRCSMPGTKAASSWRRRATATVRLPFTRRPIPTSSPSPRPTAPTRSRGTRTTVRGC
jgi:thermitase